MFANRREMLARSTAGFGSLALASMIGQPLVAQDPAKRRATGGPLAPKAPHFKPRFKRVVHLFMNGGPSQIDTFDPKPALKRFDGKPLPSSRKTERATGGGLASPFKFKRHGESGIEISELFPHVAESADELCVIRSMHTDVPNHEPSLMMMNCGDSTQSRPSLGAWTVYGLGTENANLPGFVVLCPKGLPTGGSPNWRSSFLPGIYQGTHVDTNKSEIRDLLANIQNDSVELTKQREQVDLVQRLNRKHLLTRRTDPRLEARIESLELAFGMQLEATEAFDVNRESKETLALYGDDLQGRQLLMTRRLLERGVRFVQVWHGQGQPWDSHNDVVGNHRRLAQESDKAIGAFLKDLMRTGLLEDTLVIWGGEFGRTPTVELANAKNGTKGTGRDHNHYGFSMWLAGGGVRGGSVWGQTDEFGFAAIEDKIHVHDLHATILHGLGFDHEKLTYRWAGRDFRLTDVHGHVVDGLFT